MTWDDCLALGATRLAAILGCPVTTAHSWIRRSGPDAAPPQWQRDLYIPAIVADQKRHNKTEKPTTTARKSKRKDGA
jgi:uncharacterized protein YjcR